MVDLAGMNFQKKSVICQKIKKWEKGLNQLSDPPERIVVEMLGGSDRPKGPPSPKGPPACRPLGRFSSRFAVLAPVLPF